MSQRTFQTYNSLLLALRRSQMPNYGSLARLLLETFVSNGGELRAGVVVNRGLCKEGEFTKWRDSLIQHGWLTYTIGNFSKHLPGPKLLKYINKEKMISAQIATIEDVDFRISKSRMDLATKEELAKVREELEDFKKVVTQMIQEFDPPVTDEKIQRRLRLVGKNR